MFESFRISAVVEMIISCLLTTRLLFVKKTLLTEVKARFRDPLLCLRAFDKRSDSLREPILMTTPCTVHHLLCPASQVNRSDSQQKTRPCFLHKGELLHAVPPKIRELSFSFRLTLVHGTAFLLFISRLSFRHLS